MTLRKCKFCEQDRDAILDFWEYRPTKCKRCMYATSRKSVKNNTEKVKEYQRLYRQEYRKKMAPAAKLRKNVSRVIGRALSSGKNGDSCTKYLPYSFQELKEHLEKQFEPWMNWKNYGLYDSKTWNDNVPSTWTWNVDHIIPQSTFKYFSMKDNEFQQCWALSNLRPLASKNNFLEGVRRDRH